MMLMYLFNYLVNIRLNMYCSLLVLLFFIRDLIIVYNKIIIDICISASLLLCNLWNYNASYHSVQSNKWFLLLLGGVLDNIFITYNVILDSMHSSMLILYILFYYACSIISDYLLMLFLSRKSQGRHKTIRTYILKYFKLSVFFARFIPGMKTIVMYLTDQKHHQDFLIYNSLSILANILMIILYIFVKKYIN